MTMMTIEAIETTVYLADHKDKASTVYFLLKRSHCLSQ